MPALNTFATQIGPIPLNELDSNFATPIRLGSTDVALGGTYVTLTGLTLTSPTLTSPILGTPVSGNFSSGTFTWPTFNQNTTGNASTATTAGTAATANNLSGGAANRIPYQTSSSVTGFITAPTVSSTYLSWDGSSYTWQSAVGGVTSVTGASPIASTGGATPAISISQSTTSTNGYLSSTDWTTFNNKQATLVSGTNIKTVNSTSLLGSGDISVGVTSVTGTAPVVSSGGATPAISMAAATTSANGYLTSTDWNTFNGKQSYGPYVDVRNYGYSTSASGATNATAINNAIASLPATGGAVYFPQGLAVVNSTITVNYPSSNIYSLSFIGAGADVTTIAFEGCNGFTINCNGIPQSVHFRDMTLTTNAANTYIGVTINNSIQLGAYAQSDFTRVNLRGNSIALTNYWNVAINTVGMSNINFDTCLIYGNAAGTGGLGISVAGDAAGAFQYGVVFNIDKCGLYNLGIGINYGTYIQGVTVSQTNIVNGTTGIYLASGSVGATQMSCTLCNFDVISNLIFLNAAIATVNITANSFYIPASQFGIYTVGGDGYTIVGNSFYGDPPGVGTGVYVAGTSTGVVTGNTFTYVNTGVNLVGSSTGWNVQANRYPSTTTTVANVGSNSVGVATQ
jgi:hypothetical protein